MERGLRFYVYDGTYTWADISAAFPADFISNGTFLPSYRAAVSVQIGDTTTNAAATSLVDATDSTVIFDSGKTLLWRTTQTTSWTLTLGTKIGSGDEASGFKGGTIVCGASTTPRGTVKLYGVKWVQNTGTLAGNVVTTGACEAVNCIIQCNPTSGSSLVSLGSSSVVWDNIYNVDIANSTNSGQVVTALQGNNVSRVTVAAGAALSFIVLNNNANTACKDVVFFGSPSTSTVRYTSGAATNQEFVRPTFIEGVAKFSASAGPNSADNGAHERWLYEVKCVTGDGDGVSGIPVRLTDSDSNVQVDTTTDANGEISFGSGLTAQSVIVMDHWFSGGTTYTQRSRSPFLVEINMPTQSGYNNNYFSHRYYFNWPGDESVTTTSGAFEDVADVIQMSAVTSGGGTTWTETPVP